MKRILFLPMILATLVVVACGPGEVDVIAEIELRDPESGEMELRPLGDLEVRLFPFDRDAVFDSLSEAHDTPEPQMDAELQIQQDSMVAARAAAREAESQVLVYRERLAEISEETQQYSQAEARYRELVREFDEIDVRYEAAQSEMRSQFEVFEDLQRRVLDELDAFRVEMELWEDQAFADYPDVVDQKLAERGVEILDDRTDGTGMVRFRPAPGEWWVHARYQTATEELYWNVRVDVERGEPVEVRLTRDNAEVRRIL